MAASPQHATLVANTVTRLVFDEDFRTVEVTNVNGAAAVYFNFEPAGGTDPDIEATGCHVLPAAICSVEIQPPTNKNTVVALKSAGTPKVSVRGL